VGALTSEKVGVIGVPGEVRVGKDSFLKCTMISSIWLDIISIQQSRYSYSVMIAPGVLGNGGIGVKTTIVNYYSAGGLT
jgi:hypothetical protein